MSPIGALLAFARAWLANAPMPAHCGEPALVPPTMNSAAKPGLLLTTRTPPSMAALYATSGPLPVSPSPDWYDGTPYMILGAPPVAAPNCASFQTCSPP